MTVDFYVWSTNAVSGKDYIATNGTVVFDSNTMGNLKVNLIDNEVTDPPGIIFITLTNAPPGVILTNAVKSIDIVDGDGRFDAIDLSFSAGLQAKWNLN